MSCDKCKSDSAPVLTTGDSTAMFGVVSAPCLCGPERNIGIHVSNFPGDISRIEKEASFAHGWFNFGNNLQLNAANQTVVDFKLFAQCFSAELLDSLNFAADNPSIMMLIDRVRVEIAPQAVPLDPAIFNTIRRSLYLRVVNSIGTYTQSLYMNTGTAFVGGAFSTGTGTVTDLAAQYAGIQDDRIKPTMMELSIAFGDSQDQIVSRQNLATAGAYRWSVSVHGTAFGSVSASLRERNGDCHPTKLEALARFIQSRARDSAGLAAGGYQLPPSVTG